MPTSGYSVYGLTLASHFDLGSLLPASQPWAEPDVHFVCVDEAPRVDLGAGRIVYRSDLIRVMRHERGLVMEFGDTTTHYVSGNRIVCHRRRPGHDYLIPIQLLGMVLASWLELRGSIVLHASAVVVDGRAAVFAAGGKAGKTSLAVEFARSGSPLLTEDLVHIRQGETFSVEPGYPHVRMWPDSGEHFLGDLQDLDLYHPGFTKLWVPVEKFGSFAGAGAPLAAIYFPERREEEQVEVTELGSLDAIKRLIASGFLSDMMEPAPDTAARLESMGRMVAAVPIRGLAYPSGYRHLELVRQTVTDDLRSIVE
jgi:hypothetical protein